MKADVDLKAENEAVLRGDFLLLEVKKDEAQVDQDLDQEQDQDHSQDHRPGLTEIINCRCQGVLREKE